MPNQIGELQSLGYLDLHLNSLDGSKLMSDNSLTVNASQYWLPPFDARAINMSSCPPGPKFPPWLWNQTNLSLPDLSNTGLSENFPDWFWHINANNNMVINLSDDHIKGKLPAPIGGVRNSSVLLLACNRFGGSIPSAFCESNNLQVLNLAGNDLSGVLPDCWNNNSSGIIDISDNKLSGGIPSSIGSRSFLRSLHLRNNSLTGKIPLSLKRCERLITLDLGNNESSGTILEWIGESLSSLKVLRLRSNMLDGT